MAMFVNKDFFDDDEDDNIDLNATPYQNPSTNQNTRQRTPSPKNVQSNFDNDWDNNTFTNNNSQSNVGSNTPSYKPADSFDNFGASTTTTQFTSKPMTGVRRLVTGNKRTIGGSTGGQNFLYGNDNNNNDSPETKSAFPQSTNTGFNRNFESSEVKSASLSQSINFNQGYSNNKTNDLDFTDFTNDVQPKSAASYGNNSIGNDSEPRSGTRTGGLSRPGTSSGNDLRQKALLQQKQRLLDQQRMQFSQANPLQSNDMMKNKSTTGSALYYKNEERKDPNYDDLARYAYEGKKEDFYDPSMKKNTDKAKFELTKANQNIKYDGHDESPTLPTPTPKQQNETIKPPPEKEPKSAAERSVDPEEDSDKDDDDEPTKEQIEELERRKQAEKLAHHQNAARQEAKVELINPDVAPEQDSSNYELRILSAEALDSIDMKTFLMRPAPKGYLIQCTIKRDKSGMARFYPKYYVHLSNGYRFLMGAKKRGANKTSNYVLTMNAKDFNNKSNNYLGKLRSNFLGTEFNIWDSGLNPKKTAAMDKVREQLGVVLYDANLLGAKGPRKMRVLVPEVKPTGESYQFKPMTAKESMLTNFQSNRTEGFKVLYNKPPKWNEQFQAFVLNFNGRVEKPSVKNFQLIEEADENLIMLQFGRVNNDTFNMDFQWPLSPFQAFSICLSSFDYKFACE